VEGGVSRYGAVDRGAKLGASRWCGVGCADSRPR
jgi:hypothetical protein